MFEEALLVGVGFAAGCIAGFCAGATRETKPPDIVEALTVYWRRLKDNAYAEALWEEVKYTWPDSSERRALDLTPSWKIPEARREALARRFIRNFAPKDADERARGIRWLEETKADEAAARRREGGEG